MGVVNYDSIEGEIYGDSDSEQYLRDALGSVTATVSSGKGEVHNSYRYRPSGLPLSSMGAEPEPKFKWVGTVGYRDTPMSHSQNYVRARHYGQNENLWTTVDPLWPGQPKFHYAKQNPTTLRDSTGLYMDTETFGCNLKEMCRGYPDICDALKDCRPGTKCFDDIGKCMGNSGFPNMQTQIQQALNFIRGACQPKGAKGQPTICIICGDRKPPNWPEKECGKLCATEPYGETWTVKPGPITSPPPNETICLPTGSNKCQEKLAGLGCSAVVVLCPTPSQGYSYEHICYHTVAHELVHAAGLGGAPDHNKGNGGRRDDSVYMLACCICRQLIGRNIRFPDECGNCAR